MKVNGDPLNAAVDPYRGYVTVSSVISVERVGHVCLLAKKRGPAFADPLSVHRDGSSVPVSLPAGARARGAPLGGGRLVLFVLFVLVLVLLRLGRLLRLRRRLLRLRVALLERVEAGVAGGLERVLRLLDGVEPEGVERVVEVLPL